MATITIKITLYDHTRCAEVTLQDSLTVRSLVFECERRWQLGNSDVFALRDMTRNRRLFEGESLSTAGVYTGTELQVFPLVEGG